jgi:hypothetical protein
LHEQILGADTEASSKDDEIVEMITGFFDQLETVPTYAEAVCYVNFENNYSFASANRMMNLLRQRQGSMKLIVVSRDVQGRDGVFTTAAMKEIMAEKMRMDMSNGLIKISRDFVARNPPKIYASLQEQLRRFRKYSKAQASADGTRKQPTASMRDTMWRFDGKIGGAPDDLALTAMMAREYSFITEQHPEFKELARLNGWVGKCG